jgi:hypothetical protein
MRQPWPSSVRTPWKIVEQEHAAPGVPRLQFKGVARAVTWELCYGGLAQTREIEAPISGQHRRACIYQHVSVLLEDRRLHLRAPRKTPEVSRDRTG